MTTGAEKILEEADTEWIVERIDRTGSILLYIEGAEFPQKGIPTPEALWATNIVKKVCLEVIHTLAFFPFSAALVFACLFRLETFLNRATESFNWIAIKVLQPYYMDPERMTPFARELEILIATFLMEFGINRGRSLAFGKNVAHIFEYDMAYRWRMQDLLSETSASALLSSKELKRLGTLVGKRDSGRTAKQSQQFIRLFRIVLLSPRLKTALQRALNVIDFSKLQFDEGDRYWCCFRSDYDFFGLTLREREAMFREKGWKVPHSYPILK